MKLKLFCLSIFVLLFISETKAQFIRAALSLKFTFETDLSFNYNSSTKESEEIKKEAAKFVVQNVGKELVVTNANKVTKYEIESIRIEELNEKNKKVESISLYLNKDVSPNLIQLTTNGGESSLQIIYYYSDGKIKVYSRTLTKEGMDSFKKDIQRLSLYAQYIRTGFKGDQTEDYKKLCTICRGTGICINCHGKKIVDDMFEQGKCSECSGTGHCATCNGKGYFSN
jgi:hypothetical protein